MENSRDYDVVYKIGYSKNPQKRRDSIQTSSDGNVNVVHVFETKHNRKLETSLHNFYSHKNISGEWFNMDFEDVMNFPTMCKKIENNLDILNTNFNI